jgi:rhodanese-related sulfurtransferase
MLPVIGCRDLWLRLYDDELLVVDCRENAGDPLEGRAIPGALPMSLFELAQEGESLPEDELIVLCGTAPDGSDARCAYRLLRLKGRDAVCLKGGLREWVAAGYPTERVRRPSVSSPNVLVPHADQKLELIGG